jgi:hypothetical protein
METDNRPLLSAVAEKTIHGPQHVLSKSNLIFFGPVRKADLQKIIKKSGFYRSFYCR